jgi:hypothetical protein
MWGDEQFRLKISRYVPTVEETAVAFVEELTKLAPAPPTTGPTVVTPPDVLIAPPVSAPAPLPVTESAESASPESLMDKYAAQQGDAADPWEMRAYLPVDSERAAQLPAHVLQQEYPLMQQYGEQRDAAIAAEVGPEGAPPAPEKKKGAGIGTVLLLAAPLALTLL